MRIIRLDENSIVVEVKTVLDDYELKENEIINDIGQFGQRMLEDSTFEDVPIEPIELMPTLEEKLDSLEKQIVNDNLTTFDVLATMYEESTTNTLTQFDVLATMFDEILALRDEINQLKGATN